MDLNKGPIAKNSYAIFVTNQDTSSGCAHLENPWQKKDCSRKQLMDMLKVIVEKVRRSAHSQKQIHKGMSNKNCPGTLVLNAVVQATGPGIVHPGCIEQLAKGIVV